MPDPLILGSIEMRRRTSLDGLDLFCASLRRVNPTARLVLFSRSPDHVELNDLLRAHGAEMIDALAFERKRGIPEIGVACGRFLDYAAWLPFQNAETVILADVLDVVFQRDPATLHPQDLSLYQEAMRIASCPYNMTWAERFTGQNDYRAWVHQPVICCGVILGPHKPVCRYLDWYDDLTRQRIDDGTFFVRGWDQILPTVYAYREREAEVFPFGHRDCVHLGYAPPEAVTWDGQIRVNGVAPAIVHQYKHHPTITRALWDAYRGAT